MVTLTRWTAAALAAAGWLVVVRALWFGTPSTDPRLDIDAGGALALNIDVYLPAVGLVALMLGVLAWRPRPAARHEVAPVAGPYA